MVKINLLDLPEEKTPHSVPDNSQTIFNDSPSVDMDFSFFPDQNEETNPITARPTPPQESYKVENPFKQTVEIDDEPFEDEMTYDKPNKVLYAVGAVLLVALLGLMYVIFWDSSPSDTPISNQINTPSSQIIDPTPAPVPTAITRQYKANQAANRQFSNYTAKFINLESNVADNFLVVVTNTHAYLSILGESREAIAKFRSTIMSQNPQLNLVLESIEDKYIDDKKMMLADFSSPLANGSRRNSNAAPTKVTSLQASQAKLSSLAKSNNLRIQYLNKNGERKRSNGLFENYFYTNISGNKTAVSAYIKTIANQLPSVNISKISIYPINNTSISSGNVRARLELIIYSK